MRRERLLLPALLLVVSACGGGGDPACLETPEAPATHAWVESVAREHDGWTVVDEDGQRIRVPLDPRRILSTLPGLTETVLLLGGAERLVGVSPFDDDRPELAGRARVSMMPIAWERIQGIDPDLILADAVLLGADLEKLSRRFGAVLPLRSRSLADLRESVDLLATLLDDDAARRGAETFRAELTAALDAVRRPEGASPPRVLLLAQPDPVYVLGPGALLDDMLRACGGVNVACDLGRASGPFASELVRTRRPDWILVTGGRKEDVLTQAWSDVPAVTSGRILRADADDLVRAGPRIPAALRRLGDVLHGRAPPAHLEAAR